MATIYRVQRQRWLKTVTHATDSVSLFGFGWQLPIADCQFYSNCQLQLSGWQNDWQFNCLRRLLRLPFWVIANPANEALSHRTTVPPHHRATMESRVSSGRRISFQYLKKKIGKTKSSQEWRVNVAYDCV